MKSNKEERSKMVKRRRIEFLKKRLKRKETIQMGLPFNMENELSKSLEDWKYKFHSNLDNTIKLYQSSYSEIEWAIIKPTIEFDDFPIGKFHPLDNNFEESFKIRVPNLFIELDIKIEFDETETIKWIDTELDKELLTLNLNGAFHEVENLSFKLKQLIVREQIIQYLKEIWASYGLKGATINILHKKVHFIDSTNGVVEMAILNIMANILDYDSNDIKSAIEVKFRSFEYYYKNMRYESIEVYEAVPSIKRSGNKLIYPNEHQDNASILVKRVYKNDPIAKKIKNALYLRDLKQKEVIKNPEFGYALVFRDDKENIEGIFHLCFKTRVIQNEKGIFMDTNQSQMDNLKKIIKISR